MTMRSGPGALPPPIRRVEDERLITGAGRYVADLAPPDALVAWFVRSPFAAGELGAVDTSAAGDMPGVVAVYTAADLELPAQPAAVPGGAPAMGRPMLARDRVCYVGEAVALVVAESAPQAEDAAGMVFLDVEPTDPVVTVEDSLRDETLVHPAAGSNVVFRQQIAAGPEPPAGLTEVTVTVDHPRLAPSPIETLTMLASPSAAGLDIHVGVQAPHTLQQELAEILEMPVEQLRVVSPDVGGAFGMKRFYSEYAVLAKAALLLQRPLLWVQTRREIFQAGTQGRGLRHEVTLAADESGRIHCAKIRLYTDTGAYPHRAVMIALFARLVASGLYDIPRIEFEIIATATNLPPTAPYRGAGRPEAALAIERAVDALARALGLDPAEVRRRNFIASVPHETVMGAKYDSGDYRAAFDEALVAAGYEDFLREQAERRERGAKPIGIGIGAFIERAGGQADSWEYGEMLIEPDGSLVARTGSTSAGQGHETAWRRVAAEVFDVAPEAIRLEAGDTALVADSFGSFASRSAQIGASALWRCAERVRVAATELAAEMLEAAAADMQVSGGAFHVAGSPEARVTLAEVAAFAAERGVELHSEEHYSPGAQTFPYGVHIAKVEVDPETGLVTPLSLVAVDDVGTVLDEMLVGGQLAGSVMQGLAAALLEEMHYTEDGQPRAATFIDYLLPTAMQLVPLHSEHLTSPAPSNPLGAKGAGEGGCIGIPPAILNATIDALAPFGITELQIPLTPHKVWTALQAAGGSS